ncbi:MAG: hypothetical protein J1E64_04740 [Acetatifactor sp.]|nr:hypothetical protein [Acetatifactor sp.]
MKRKIILGTMLLSLGMALAGCADFYALQRADDLAESGGREDAARTETDDTAEGAQEEPESAFGAVPYFRDDTGRDAQEVDGYLYGFWGGRFCRYDMDTWEETLLYEAPCNQAGNFFIQGEDIYFLTRHGADSLDHADICLYRMKLDGSDLTLLCDNIPDIQGQIWDNYEIDMYQDIFYLTSYYNLPDLFYRLEGDEAVPVEESETLHGMIPERYEALEDSSYIRIPSVAYMMRNYGYLFVRDRETHDLYRFDPGEGTLELLMKSDVLGGERKITKDTMFLTNEAFYFCDDAYYSNEIGQWYRLSLEGRSEPEKWVQTSVKGLTARLEIFWDEDGVWLIDTLSGGERRAFWASREDTRMQQIRSFQSAYQNTEAVFSDQPEMFFRGKDSFYYNKRMEEGDAIVRLADNKREEAVTFYDTSYVQYGQLCDKRVETYEIYGNPDSDEYFFCLYNELLYLTGDTKASRKINACLERVYQEQKKTDPSKVWYEEKIQEWMEDGIDGNRWNLKMDVVYLDEDHLCVRVREGGWIFTAWVYDNDVTEYYVFDLATGERLSITDLVEDSKEEICNIIAPYVEEECSFSEWTPRESILEEKRFFLDESGIGIHYDAVDMGSEADSAYEFIIPYEKFIMKNGK